MDRKSKALGKFRKPYSCAQTVYAAYASDAPDDLAEMAANSGGRAPDNMCGALYAALKILPERRRDAAKAEFAKLAGSTKCLEIKTKFGTPCPKCVEIAADILEKS